MIQQNRYFRLARSGRGVFWLNVSTFWLSFGLGVMFLSYPFVLKHFGASDSQVGICFALYMGIYATGCLFQGVISHRLHPKRTSQFGIFSAMLMALGMTVAVYLGQHHMDSKTPLISMIVIFVLCGSFFSFIWPLVMGWVSTGVEGVALNRRLGLYNVSWSSGGLISPLIGGWLVEWSYTATLGLVFLSFLMSFVCLSRARYQQVVSLTVPPLEILSEEKKAFIDVLWRFRWLAWVGLFCASICSGALRSQLGLYMKMDLGFTEKHFGIVIWITSITNFLSLMMAGRTKKWHFRLGLYIAITLMSVIGMILLATTRQMWIFCIAMALLGVGAGFTYASHMYYGVSGGKRRSARMAVHEFTLSAGFLVGAYVGGVVSDHFGRTTPYTFCISMFAVGAVAQMIIWAAGYQRAKKTADESRIQ